MVSFDCRFIFTLLISPLRLPVYEASHEFDKHGRRQQPLQASIAPPCPADPPRLPPAPMINNILPYHNCGHGFCEAYDGVQVSGYHGGRRL
jgi:hypothetical protein